jgi:hypothetical protein
MLLLMLLLLPLPLLLLLLHDILPVLASMTCDP